MRQLNLESLSDCPTPKASASGKLSVPAYNPATNTAGIVHLGVGNFHRAHQAVYIDDILARSSGPWRIIGVSMRSPTMRDKMAPQQYLYTLKEMDQNSESLRVIGAIARVLVAPEDPQAVIDVLSAETTTNVTLTVTEKGYCLKPGSRSLDLSLPDIQHDITHPTHPRTVIGFLLAAARNRMQNQIAGFNVLSCDNLPNNAQLLRDALLCAARLVDSALAEWIQTNLGFCNTMVDRIVPATTAEHQAAIEQQTGLKDEGSLICETFRQWIIEDNFVAPTPDWQSAGALVVDDVAPYEKMKLRLLNGSHSALAYLGHLAGYTYIHEAVNDPAIRGFVKQLMQSAMRPTLPSLKGVDLDEYCQTLIARFANAKVPYRCAQVASDGSQKLPQRALEPATELLKLGKPTHQIATLVGAWLAFLTKSRLQSDSYDVNDPGCRALLDMIAKQCDNKAFPTTEQSIALLTHSGIVPSLLLNDAQFTSAVHHAFTRFLHEQTVAVLQSIECK
ncbi:mannitol dehydrogenase family protein [Simiduia sp. 21SJ11W-1]|uniref:mannitol dehydrogenase family protein n=1 Tax=Simiduia sp. 21SJ11W-1 TaxID=2909669 RepID=UPI0020A00F40|nr:mannitol dehydrogenase family protein [Simiduia sp. 21SJ11W-1]UTA48646.1 mannitol dehydrogenase family protein [Simiduia sp. 21SJ11W-1]